MHSVGARRSRPEAEELLAEAQARVQRVGGHNDRYWIEEIDTTGLFQIPQSPAPRERFTVRTHRTSAEGAWTMLRVEVLDGDRVIADYNRNHTMFETFEPFRQGDRYFALVAPDYTATSVMDLSTGRIIASEDPNPGGFCPAGFYVPDWWDIHDGSILPGSMQWSRDNEWPRGDFGFVWGCIWGDDISWKVQYLDLSGVAEGQLRRDARFGYLPLATNVKLVARDFIRCWSHQGRPRVEFSTRREYALDTGDYLPPEEV